MTTTLLVIAITASLLASAWALRRHRRGRPARAAAPAVLRPATPAPPAVPRPPPHARPRSMPAEPAPDRQCPTPIAPVIDGAIATALRAIRPGARHWQVDPALRRLVLHADPAALEGALAVLLRRAVLHSREDDVIALRWVTACETVAIVVEDEGDGIAGPGTETDESGDITRLGIGLSLARTLAAAQGGDVRLEAAPGIGARAWLTLPRARVLEAA